MRRACAIVGIVGLVIAGVAVAGAALLLHGGISARPEPWSLEVKVARTLRRWAIPSDARDAKNPIAASPPVLEEGLAHFADHCATCHANDGSGRTGLGGKLYPRAPDLRAAPTQELTDGELFYIIENGVRFTGMPAWGGEHSGEGSWHLVHFIRHLPSLTEAEKARMEALNPKSPEEWRALEEEGALRLGDGPAHEGDRHGDHTH